MQRTLILDAVVRKRAAIELLAREVEALLVRLEALLVLDLELDAVDAV
jgi:hypothetical protein